MNRNSLIIFKIHWQLHWHFEVGITGALEQIQYRSLQVYLVEGCCKWTLLIRGDILLFHLSSKVIGCEHVHYSIPLCSFQQVHFLSCSPWRKYFDCLFSLDLFHIYWLTKCTSKRQFMMVYSLGTWSHSTGIYIFRMTCHKLFHWGHNSKFLGISPLVIWVLES